MTGSTTFLTLALERGQSYARTNQSLSLELEQGTESYNAVFLASWWGLGFITLDMRHPLICAIQRLCDTINYTPVNSMLRYSANLISRLTVEGKRPQERILIQQKTREINAILASPGMKDIIGSSSFIFPRLPRFNANLFFPEVLQEQNAEEQDDANPEQVPEQLDQVQEEVMQETGLGALIPGTEEGWGIRPRLPSFQPPRFDPLAPKTISASLTIKMVVLTLCLGSFVYWSILPELNSIEYIPPRLICFPVRQPYDLNRNALRESLNVATGSQEFGLGMSEKLIIEKLPTESTSRLRLTLDGFPDDDSPKSAGFYIAMIILAMTVTAAAAGFSSIR